MNIFFVHSTTMSLNLETIRAASANFKSRQIRSICAERGILSLFRPVCFSVICLMIGLSNLPNLTAEEGELPLMVISGFGPDSIDLGRVQTGSCDTVEVAVRNTSSERVIVDGVDLLGVPSLRLLSPSPGSVTQLEPDGELILQIVFCPIDTPCVPGRIEVTGYPESVGPIEGRETQAITLRACGGRPEISIVPPTLDVGTAAIGDRVEKSAALQNLGNTPLRIDSIALSNLVFDAIISRPMPLTISPGDSALITVGFTPTTEGATSGILSVYSSDPIRPITPVQLSGLGVERRLSTNDNHDFGRLLSGRCHDSILSIVNASPLPTVISRIEIVDVEINDRARNFSLSDDPQFPITLAPGETYSLKVRYCASSERDVSSATLWIEQEKGAGESTRLRGRGRRPFVGANVFGLGFGSVIAGRCVDTTLWIRSGEKETLQLETVVLEAKSGSGTLTIVEPTGFPVPVPPFDSVLVAIRFCPENDESASWWMNASFDVGNIFPQLVTGRGIIPAIWIDTVSFEAGETGELMLHVWPTGALNRTGGTIELELDPNALFVTDVRPHSESQTPPVFRHRQNILGHVIIETDDQVHTGKRGELLSITVRGLVTGKPINRVSIARTSLADSILRWDTLTGLVNLSGCDVGAFGGTARSITIGSIHPNPASEMISILYRVPEGYTATVTLFDSRGAVVLEENLPIGTGQIEEYVLRLDHLPHGFYMLELVDRQERRLHPLFVE